MIFANRMGYGPDAADPLFVEVASTLLSSIKCQPAQQTERG